MTSIVQREDVRVGQPRCDSDLTQEALDPEARGELGMENFDGDRSVVFQVCRQEDRRHPSAADRAVYRVAVCEAGLQTSEEGGQAALPRPWLKDSRASAMPGILLRSPDE